MNASRRPKVRYYQTSRLSRRSVLVAPFLLAFLYVTLFSASAFAFIRLSSGAVGLYWAQAGAGPIAYTIQARGSDDIPDSSEDAAIRMSFETWNQVANSYVSFVEDRGPNRNRGDWEAENLHLVFFDENNSSGFFSGNAGIVAVTPLSFEGSGRITDADIIINGYHHRFSADGRAGTFDVQDIVTHEVGHFLGLDHSGVVGSTMYPFAFANEIHQRSLSSDDVAGVTSLYPATGNGLGGIAGRAVHADGSPVIGGHAVAVDTNGDAVGVMTGGDGRFVVSALPRGQYQVYVEPLDGPVETAHLYSRTVQTDFSTVFWTGGTSSLSDYPTYVEVTPGIVTTLPADLRGGPAGDLNVSSAIPPRLPLGGTYNVNLSGSGFSPSCTASILGDGAQILSAQFYGSGSATLRVQVSSFTEPGLRTVVVRDGTGRVAALTGGIEVLAPAPSANEVTPTLGDQAGGTRISVRGANFRPGARMTIGGVQALDVTYVGPYRLDATAPANTLGSKDVVVINPDGQNAILRNAFEYSAEPVVGKVEPSEGPTVGGQRIVITGANFPAGVGVLIGGKEALSVKVVSSSTLEATSPAGLAGSMEVRVVLPNGTYASLADGYTYVFPRISKILPTAGSTAGGTRVVIRGRGFGAGIKAYFDDLEASSVTYTSSEEIVAVTPAGSIGSVRVGVRNVDDHSAFSEERFQYLDAAEPRISAVSPATGPVGGGTSITVTGSGFEAGATLWLGGVKAPEAKVLADGRITAITPAHEGGTVDLWVTNPDGLTGIVPGGFRYYIPSAVHQAQAPRVKGKSAGGCSAGGPVDPAQALGGALPLILLVLGAMWLRLRRSVLGEPVHIQIPAAACVRRSAPRRRVRRA